MNCLQYLIILFFIFVPATQFVSCGQNAEQNQGSGITRDDLIVQKFEFPDFSKDSAYHFIEKQLAFGPRVPNTRGHRECANFLESTLLRYTPNVSVQRGRVDAYDGTRLNIFNIEANFYPDREDRILLCAHWDTRHVADFERDPEQRMKPIPGANDGASGVAVLLEIARVLSENDPGIGVDIVLFDAEDYGVPHFKNHIYQNNDSWALGSQYWARNLSSDRIKPQKGILLDMVGAYDAVFMHEGYSMQFAPDLVREVWQIAQRLGYSGYFRNERTIPITDDHYYVNTIARIPTINIIDHDPGRRPRGFGHYWHTHDDDIDIISKETLQAVGETLLAFLFRDH